MISKLLPLFCSPAKKSNVRLLVQNTFSLLLLVMAVNVQAQVSSYTVSGTSTTPAYTAIVGTPLFGTTWDDGLSGAINIGFTFNFNGKDYTQCYLSTNGFITFGSAPSANNYNPISNTLDSYEGAISVYGRNLVSSGLPVRYVTAGTFPNRTFTVQYNALRATGVLNAGTYNMQIILHESDAGNVTDRGYVELRYAASSTSSIATAILNGEIGLRGETSTDFNNKSYTSTASSWPAASPVLPRGTANTDFVSTRTATPSINKVYNLVYAPPTCFAPTKVTAIPASITQSSATVTWVAPTPAPAGGYEYIVSTTAPTNINVNYPLPGTTITGTTTATTIPVTGLPTPGGTYYVYVRSVCAGKSGWSAAGVFTTLCSSWTVNPPYEINFTGTVGTYPGCTRVETTQPTDASFGFWATRAASSPDWGFTNEHIRITSKPASPTSGPNASSFFTRGVYLVTTKSYRLSYKYGASAEVSTTTQNLRVAYGTAPLASAMTTVLENHVAFRGGPYTNVENFIPPVDGVYYIGFIETTPQLSATTLLDDIVISESTCIAPSGLISGLVTETSAAIAWTGPGTAPADGYLYYVNTTGTAPGFNTVATGSSTGLTGNLSGLTPSTTYYFWVRSNCGNGDMSGWSLVPGTFTTLAAVTLPAASCTPVSANTGTWITKFSTTGALANISNTSVYSLPNGYGDYTAQAATQFQDQTVNFTVLTNGTSALTNVGIAIWVDWNQDGTFAASERVFNTTSYVSNATGTFTVPTTAATGPTRMRVMIDYFSTNPANPCAYSSTGPRGETEDYRFTVLAKPLPITLSAANATTCSGVQTPALPAPPVTITSGAASYNAFYWTPAPTVSGDQVTGYRFTPNITTTYTLTALNTTTFETTSVKFTVFVNQPPTAIAITPATTTTVCEQGPAVALTATGGIISGIEILKEDFNGEAPGWLSNNASTGLFAAEVAWYLQPDGYDEWPFPIHSNDRSQFALTDSDAGNSTTITRTGLISPEINLTGYTTASLSFWHFYKYYSINLSPESARVQYSTSTSGPWTDLVVYPGNPDIGSYSNFVNAVVDLTPAIPSGIIYLQFAYQAQFDYGWAIDNVLVSGSGSTSISWSPSGAGNGLYTDAAAQTLYTGGPATTVYALPSANQVYTASASSGLGCQTSSTVSVVVTEFKLGTSLPANQTTCTGEVPADIILSGNNGGAVVRWEASPNSTFLPAGSVISIPVTSTTLTPVQIKGTVGLGLLTRDYYFRPILTGCVVNKPGPVVKVTVPSTTWNGTAWSNLAPDGTKMVVYDGNATIASNMSACALIVKSGTVTVNSGITVDLAHAVTVDGGVLVFSDDASLLQTATGNNINTGNIVYRRNSQVMVPYDYTYWSSPVQFQTLFDFSPLTRFDKYFEWNPVLYEWAQITAPGSTVMAPGKGYIMRAGVDTPAGGAAYIGNFIGTPNNGTITQQVYVDPSDLTKDTNLLGNPYPSAIDAEALMRDPANAVSLGGGTTFYYWTHNHPIANQVYDHLSDYASYNYTGGTGTTVVLGATGPGNTTIPTKYIAAGQGFIAAVKGSGFNTVTFNNAIRVGANNTNFYKTQDAIEKHRVWLEIKDGNRLYKQILVGYIEGATDAYDNGYDGLVLDGGNGISFYSFIGNEAMNTQGKALPFNQNDQVPLGYKAGAAGMLHIAMPLYDGLFTEQPVYLEDRLLQVVHDLRQGAYSFATEAGTFNERFILRYTDTTLGNVQPLMNENAVVVYKNNHNIHIKSTGFNMESVKIFDINGRMLTHLTGIGSNATEISNLQAAQQVLLITITTDSGVVIHKKIIF